jgi:hypothetical protein
MQHEPDEYTGCGTDEHWRSFDDYEPMAMADDTQGPQVTAPSLTASLAFAPKPIFMWNIDAALAGMKAGDVPYMSPSPSCMDCCPQFNTGALTTVHEPAVSGDVYDLQFFDASGALNHRVVTTLQEWTPPDDLWASWKGKTYTLKIYRVQLLLNDLKAGPFIVTKPPTFTVGS